jgi:hypothetical protein
MWTRKLAVVAGVALLGVSLQTPAAAAHNRGLPLGPRDLPETRTGEALQPGVTLTTVVRGAPDPADTWTVEVSIPGGTGSSDPAAGAPGDPAGVGVYDGHLLSEPTNGRPAFTFSTNGRHAAVTRTTWAGTASSRNETLRLDGVNRVPGLIRNCGGIGDTRPTAHYTTPPARTRTRQ